MKLMLVGVVLLVLVFPLISYAGDSGTVSINATVVGTCKFNTPKETTISVTLDPSINQTVEGTSSLSFWCTKGASYKVTDDDGQHETGLDQNRVYNKDADDYIHYSFSYTPTSGTGKGRTNPITLTITATFLYDNYKDASEGTYTDTVEITVEP